MLLFYAPDFTPRNPVLPHEEAHHALKVLRLPVGALVHVTDGNGHLHQVKVVSADLKNPLWQVLHTQARYGARPYRIHVAVAPTKNTDRTEWLVEKCVELGVDEISFLACERSERRHFKTDRLQKIVVSAMKQSLKAYLPPLHDMVSLLDFVSKAPVAGAQRFMAHLDEEKKEYLSQMAAPGGDYCVLIGPEGDFSPGEVTLARQAGFAPVSLGQSRLRTETAAVAACHTLHVVNEKRPAKDA